MGDQILVSLHPHQKRIFTTNPSRMRSNLSLILFGLLVLLALSAVRAEEEEGNSLSEEMAEARVARSPDAKRRRKMRKGKGKGKGNRRAKKARRGKKRNQKNAGKILVKAKQPSAKETDQSYSTTDRQLL